ncbi:hypothetical protein HGRIS_012582 [Hohenbuehelia grisea]|uniref:Uncharacterized protein n=1 Tax=Hohenbuehelia grisea TaxID=104357 RepID=A0ABR3ISP1_9AGAR
MSSISRLPFDKLGIAVLTNDGQFGAEYMQVIKHRIIDHALGLPHWDCNNLLKNQVRTSQVDPGRPREPNATMPSRNLSFLAGIYENLGYGRVELCEIPFKVALPSEQSEACKTLADEIPVTLPGVIDPSVPSLFAKWEGLGFQYIKLGHYNQSVFNFTAWSSNPTFDEAHPFWVANPAWGTLPTGEFAYDSGTFGLGLIGNIWGAGTDVKSPAGDTPRERAEVWFDKI